MRFSRQECWSVLPFPSPSVPPTTKWKGFPCEGWRNLSRKLKNQFWKARSETTYGRQACPGFLPEILTLSVVPSPRASTTGALRGATKSLMLNAQGHCSSDGKESACSVGDLGSIPGSRRSSEGNGYPPTPVFLPGIFHRQRSLAGYSSRDCKESDTTQQLTHT